MMKHEYLAEQLQAELGSFLTSVQVEHREVTVFCELGCVKSVLAQLRDHATYAFDQLIDLCVVDYLTYGQYDWETDSSSEHGFSRGVERQEEPARVWDKPRFAVVYHLLSTTRNHRCRVKVFIDDSHLTVPSVHDLWKGANWFEREAYDLFGVLFEGHPDLRRILTDYGFIGYPLRKDFPVSGQVEMRYDAALKKVVYEPVEIEPRVLVPKVIRDDNRYLGQQENNA